MRFLATIIILKFSFLSAMSQTFDGRIESEYKLSVPDDQVDAVWTFLKSNFNEKGMMSYGDSLTTDTSIEVFHDLYFDSPDEIIAKHKSGVRYRERYINDSLVKALVQIKLPTSDSSGVARKEHKFNLYRKVSITDRTALHPFWQYIKPKDRDGVNLLLATFNITGDEISQKVKVKQIRKRIYISQEGQALMTFTLDKVSSFYFPYTDFTELELELNEIKYTEADAAEKQKMESMNQSIKERIAIAFPSVVQDQTPKYNKMNDKLSSNMLAVLYENIMYIILGFLCLAALVLFLKDHQSTKHKYKLANA